jgi:hypothetical protein
MPIGPVAAVPDVLSPKSSVASAPVAFRRAAG